MLIPTMLAAVLTYPALSEEANRALIGAPRPVGVFLERRAECGHWAGEEPYDKARGRQIAAAVRALKCGRLEADERALRRTYAKQPKVLRLLALE